MQNVCETMLIDNIANNNVSPSFKEQMKKWVIHGTIPHSDVIVTF